MTAPSVPRLLLTDKRKLTESSNFVRMFPMPYITGCTSLYSMYSFFTEYVTYDIILRSRGKNQSHQALQSSGTQCAINVERSNNHRLRSSIMVKMLSYETLREHVGYSQDEANNVNVSYTRGMKCAKNANRQPCYICVTWIMTAVNRNLIALHI